ncbi:uncharacterized protein LOC116610915 isoform X2 [Nematostella vectensis]|nr:uncharacterized protein LOC116610915 isoform X2 [Nematostella vectensis]
MATVTNGYCSSDPDKCGLQRWNVTRNFQSSDVVLLAGFPKQRDKNIELKFYLHLPAGNDIRKTSHTVLPKSVLEHLIKAKSTDVSSTVGVDVMDEKAMAPLDDTLNYIMIPLSFGVLLVLCFVACCLNLMQKRKENARRREHKRNIQMEPKPSTSGTLNTPPDTLAVRVERSKKNSKKSEIQEPSDETPTQTDAAVACLEEGAARASGRRKKRSKKSQKEEGHEEGAQANEGYMGEEESDEEEGNEDKDVGITSPEFANGIRSSKKKKRRKTNKTCDPQLKGTDSEDEGSGGQVPPDVLPSKLPPLKKLPPLSHLRKEKLDDNDK